MPRRPVVRTVLGAIVLVCATLGVLVRADAADPDLNRPEDRGTQRERFLSTDTYTGYFADPSIAWLDGQYVSAGTSTAGNVLPLMTSPDLLTFTPRPLLSAEENLTGAKKSNDAMSALPTWPLPQKFGKRTRMVIWAPSSVVKVRTRYLVAYTAHRAAGWARKSCLGLAWSDRAVGPFVDERNTPLVCFEASPLGAIDPDFFTDANGSLWLLWKQEGIIGVQAPALVTRRLAADGRGFAPGSRKRVLLVRDAPWEGNVIENPSMVFHRGHHYLFYSGGNWTDASYGTGYAVCRTAAGPCTKVSTRRPFFGSGAAYVGTGGADVIVDRSGALRMVYAAWDAGRVGENPLFARRMHVATLGPGSPRAVTWPSKPLALRAHRATKHTRAEKKRARAVWERRLAAYRWARQVERARLRVTVRAAVRDTPGPLTVTPTPTPTHAPSTTPAPVPTG